MLNGKNACCIEPNIAPFGAVDLFEPSRNRRFPGVHGPQSLQANPNARGRQSTGKGFPSAGPHPISPSRGCINTATYNNGFEA